MNKSLYIFVILVFILSFISLMTLILTFNSSLEFWNFPFFIYFLGRLSGIWGISGMALTIILSVRFAPWEKKLGGLPILMKVHHLLGAFSFTLIFLHPVLLAMAQLPVSTDSLADFLFDFEQKIIWTGWLAMLLMIFMVGTTLIWRPSYEKWRKIHALGGLILFLGLVHAFISLNDESSLPLKIFLFVFGLFGLFGFFYREWLMSRQSPQYLYRVNQVRNIHSSAIDRESVVSFTLVPEMKPMNFYPGQFAYLSFPFPEENNQRIIKRKRREWHPFSLSLPPSDDGQLGFIIKEIGDFTHQIQKIKVGDLLVLEGPYGAFLQSFINNSSYISLWIAGGIGIVPFLCYLRASDGKALTVHFHYCVRKFKEAYFAEELLELSKRITGLKIFTHIEENEGHLQIDQIEKFSGIITSQCQIYLCGPPGMNYALVKNLTKRGIQKKQIHLEDYSFI